MQPVDTRRMIQAVCRGISPGIDAGLVLCGKRSAYIERSDPTFLQHVAPYLAEMTIVDDLLEVTDDEFLKVSIFSFGRAEQSTAPMLAGFGATHTVRVSGEHWVDITNRTANKGRAIGHLQDILGGSPDQTMVFGDFLNDLEMMDAPTLCSAMDNAHPELRERANYIARSVKPGERRRQNDFGGPRTALDRVIGPAIVASIRA